MEIHEETTQKFSALNDVKLSAEDKADILQALRSEMNQKRPKRKFNGGVLSGFAAAVAAVAIVAGGLDVAHHHRLTTPSTSNRVTTASDNSTSPANRAANNITSPSKGTSNPATQDSANYASEIALIKGKGYSVSGSKPNASVQTSSGETLTAWIGVATGGDGHNQYVYFFLNGRYLGTDTAKPSLEITSAKAAGPGAIAVTYPVYKTGDSFANPTGTPVTVTYTWNGSKIVPNRTPPTPFS